MLSDSPITPTIAVKDIEAAKKFYAETLGLKQVNENMGGVTYQCGNTQLFVYSSQFAGTNQATYVVWIVDDVDTEVADLKSKGISFERYELPGTTWEGDVASMGTMKAAWFKDPDGNILSLGNKA